MAYRKTPFAVGEWYHCYSRGIDKRTTFEDHPDYMRFLEVLYLCNDMSAYNREHIIDAPSRIIFQMDRDEKLVSIGAYCLMPNHYHLLLRENVENGISRFMQKVGTAYTKYFNERNNRIGGLFVKPFRSKHIDSDVYLNRIIPYIHMNPTELYEPTWKEGRVQDMQSLQNHLLKYHYSSLRDFENIQRPERTIIDMSAVSTVYNKPLSLTSVMQEAADYYRGLAW